MTCKAEWRLLWLLFRYQQWIPDVELLIAPRDFSDPRAGRIFSMFVSAYHRFGAVRLSILPEELQRDCLFGSEPLCSSENPFDFDDFPEPVASKLFLAAEHRREGLAALVEGLPRGSRVVVASWPGVDLTLVTAELRNFEKLGDIQTFRLFPPETEEPPRLCHLRMVTDIEWKTQAIVFLCDGKLIVAKNSCGPVGTFG